MPKQEYIKIGSVGKAHGLQGAIKIHFTSNPEAITALDYFFIQKYNEKPIPFFVEELSWMDDKGKAMARLEDLDSKEKADNLFKHSVLAKYDEVFINWSEMIEMLIGFELIDQTSQTKHEIIEVYPIVNNPLLEVKTKNNTTILVPYQKEFIVKIDIKNKTLICKLPEGLV